MAKNEDRFKNDAFKAPLERDEDFVRNAVHGFVQAGLEAEITEALAVEKDERTGGRLAGCGSAIRRTLRRNYQGLQPSRTYRQQEKIATLDPRENAAELPIRLRLELGCLEQAAGH